MQHRILFSLLALCIVTSPVGAIPRPLSPAEHQAIRLVAQGFQDGPEHLWEHLSSDAPLRKLGREHALREISVRLGPTARSHWRVLTPAAHLGPGIALFDIEYATGFTETLLFELVEEEGAGWKVRQVRCLADPVELSAPQPQLAPLAPLRKRLTQANALNPTELFGAPHHGSAADVQALWEAQYHLQHQDTEQAAFRLDKVVERSRAPLAELLTARLAVLRGHGLAMEKAYARLLRQGFDHDGLRLEMAQNLLRMGQDRNLGKIFRSLEAMGSRQSEVAYGLARFAGDQASTRGTAQTAQGGGDKPLPSLARFTVASNESKLRLGGGVLELPAGLAVAAEDFAPSSPAVPRAVAPVRTRSAAPRVGLMPPKPQPPPQVSPEEARRKAQAVQTWHESYSAQVAPVKLALGPILGAIRGGRLTQMGDSCRTLVDQLTPLLSDSEVFAAPELEIEPNLRIAFYHFQKMAGACLQGRLAEIRAELTKAESSLRVAAIELQKYGLRP